MNTLILGCLLAAILACLVAIVRKARRSPVKTGTIRLRRQIISEAAAAAVDALEAERLSPGQASQSDRPR